MSISIEEQSTDIPNKPDVQLEIKYVDSFNKKTDISKAINEYLVSFECQESETMQANFVLTLHNVPVRRGSPQEKRRDAGVDYTNIWSGPWYPTIGDKLEVSVIRYGQKHKWGLFTITRLTYSGPPKLFIMEGSFNPPRPASKKNIQACRTENDSGLWSAEVHTVSQTKGLKAALTLLLKIGRGEESASRRFRVDTHGRLVYGSNGEPIEELSEPYPWFPRNLVWNCKRQDSRNSASSMEEQDFATEELVNITKSAQVSWESHILSMVKDVSGRQATAIFTDSDVIVTYANQGSSTKKDGTSNGEELKPFVINIRTGGGMGLVNWNLVAEPTGFYQFFKLVVSEICREGKPMTIKDLNDEEHLCVFVWENPYVKNGKTFTWNVRNSGTFRIAPGQAWEDIQKRFLNLAKNQALRTYQGSVQGDLTFEGNAVFMTGIKFNLVGFDSYDGTYVSTGTQWKFDSGGYLITMHVKLYAKELYQEIEPSDEGEIELESQR